MATGRRYRGGLVDLGAGLISREIFIHEEIYAEDGWDGRDGGTEVLGGVQKWLIPCNWKFPAENFSGDSYHNISHRSVDMVGIGPSGSGRRDMRERLLARRLQICFTGADLKVDAGALARYWRWDPSASPRA